MTSNDSRQSNDNNSKRSDDSPSSKNYASEPLDTARVSGFSQKSRENQKNYQESSEDKSREKRNPKISDDLYNFSKNNREQTITYILLALGLIFLVFFNTLLGGLILGMVAGYYFAPQIIHYVRNLRQMIDTSNQMHYIVLAAVLLGLFIAAPGIFIGAAIVAAFKQIMEGPREY